MKELDENDISIKKEKSVTGYSAAHRIWNPNKPLPKPDIEFIPSLGQSLVDEMIKKMNKY